MDEKELVRIAALAGEIMLSNGAEISRVEDTMSRILRTLNFKSVDAFVIPSGIFVSVDGDDSGVITIVRRIKARTFNLGKISEVNNFSRNFVDGLIAPENAHETLKRIFLMPSYHLYIKASSMAVACFCFTFMFGGTFISAIGAFFVAVIAFVFNNLLQQKRVSGVLTTLITSALIALLSAGFVGIGFPGAQVDKIIIGGIMQLVPGLGLTNGIRDAFEGDFMSATSRLLDAVLVAVSIAVGVGTVLKILMFYGLVGGIL